MINHNVKAVTLLELVIVLAIAAIISIIALPYYHDMMAKREQNKVKTLIIQSLKTSRIQAQLLHSNVVVCPSQDYSQCENNQWNSGLIIFHDSNNNRRIDGHDVILESISLELRYGNLSWRGALSAPSIRFNAQQGLPIGSNGSFYYCNLHSSDHIRIVLSKMGHTRIEHPSTC